MSRLNFFLDPAASISAVAPLFTIYVELLRPIYLLDYGLQPAGVCRYFIVQLSWMETVTMRRDLLLLRAKLCMMG